MCACSRKHLGWHPVIFHNDNDNTCLQSVIQAKELVRIKGLLFSLKEISLEIYRTVEL